MKRKFDFYIVPTPIGNISDITLRAIEVLKEVDIIACEDSRVTQKLLNHYDIKTKCISYHKYNERERVNSILKTLKDGKTMALVSDAGTPMICDPGSILISELKKNNIKITSLPGACAVTTFLSQISRETEEFKFVGFLPKSETQIAELYSENKFTNMVFYDSPNRILKTLKILQTKNPAIRIAIGRELSKLFEEIIIDDIEKVIKHFSNTEIKGEFVCMTFAQEKQDLSELKDKILKLKEQGFKAKEITEIVSTLYGINKNEIKNLLY
ncbi:16S rRNA (cytidine(1402)-2'-O)-methyltransferase [bacterium]|nr:16S rRNA (cytidine(1402)-2'-O)-methyltransferase [bacterium]